MIRTIDIFFSVAVLILSFPLLLIVSLVLKMTGENEIFYTQERVGKDGSHFNLLKFATMLKDSPNMKNSYITTVNDPRVLPFGKVLRKTKLNELPQLINVLKGDMSIVGPRPQVEDHLLLYPVDSKESILSLRPGLTGIASIYFRDEETMISQSKLEPMDFYAKYIVPYKVELEYWYIQNRTLKIYLGIIIMTAWVIFFPESTLYETIFKGIPEPPKELNIK